MPDSLSLVWGHLVHFAKFLILQFLKLCFSPNLYPISPKLYTKYILTIKQYILLFFFRGSAENYKNYAILKFFNTGPYAPGNFNVLYLVGIYT